METQDNQKILKRHQLYDLVWTTPMIDLAKQFQLSDNGLRKICKKYLIPVPKVGYWQRVKFGKEVQRPPLPIYNGEDNIIISTLPRPKMEPKISEYTTKSNIPTEPEKETIVVPEHITKFHALIVETRKHLSKTYRSHGRLTAGKNGLDMRVSEEQLPRACRIMHTIIKTLEQQGIQVLIEGKSEGMRSTCVKLDGETVFFGLEESLKYVKAKPDTSGRIWNDFAPAGKLVLHIRDFVYGGRNKWSDGKRDMLEKKLDSFINGLWVAAAIIKKKNEEHKEWNRRCQEEAVEREKKRQEQEEQKRRFETLEQQVTSWLKSRSILAFIKTAVRKAGAYDPNSKFAQWIEWATAQAKDMDPLRNLKPK